MPKITYKAKQFRPESLAVIRQANEILADYEAQGFDLTLRQLYYQFVSRDLIPNTDKSYDRLGSIISDARMAGLVDWDSIVDRTRHLRDIAFWASPKDLALQAARQYREDLWATQPNYVEVWIEKDALIGVIEKVCDKLRVPHFSCRGYTSQSEMWSAAQRLGEIALTMDQIEQYDPPPNPAKLTDARAKKYVQRYGRESWELDALSPSALAALIGSEVEELTDYAAWDEAVAKEHANRQKMTEAAEALGGEGEE